MFQRINCALLSLALAFTLIPATAHAGLTEIRKDFSGLTSLLSATAIVTAPTSDASYLICVSVSGSADATPTIQWTDENGAAQSWSSGYNGCTLIRNHANTVPTVETTPVNNATPPFPAYALSVFGFGFWPTGSQGQGGISEAVMAPNTELQIEGGDYLAVVGGYHSCSGGVSLTGRDTGTINISNGVGETEILPFSTGGYIGWYPGGGCDSANTLIIVKFGTPSSGPGPLTDYEYNLLHWTNSTYPNYKMVLPETGSAGFNVLLAANIAEVPNSSSVSEGLDLYGGMMSQTSCATTSLIGTPSGTPASCVTAAYQPPSTFIELMTYKTPGQAWGASPTYNAEVDVIQF